MRANTEREKQRERDREREREGDRERETERERDQPPFRIRSINSATPSRTKHRRTVSRRARRWGSVSSMLVPEPSWPGSAWDCPPAELPCSVTEGSLDAVLPLWEDGSARLSLGVLNEERLPPPESAPLLPLLPPPPPMPPPLEGRGMRTSPSPDPRLTVGVGYR